MARKRLILNEKEKSLIKGLLKHTDLNEQEITAIFSHASRSINHREIGYFKNPNNPKYASVTASSAVETKTFLANYKKLEQHSRILGNLPKPEYFDKVFQATEAMKSAVANFNNPSNVWKSETFCVNAVTAWTYLTHAWFMKEEVAFHHVKDDAQPVLIDGRPKLWELSKCIEQEEIDLCQPIKSNLKYLVYIRNAISHEGSSHLQRFLEPKFQACAINFNTKMCEWFGSEFDISDSLSIALSFANIDIRQNNEAVDANNLPSIIKTANLVVEKDLSTGDFNSSKYSYRVHIVPRLVNNRNKADQLIHYSAADSKIGMAVKEVERTKYRPSDIVNFAKSQGHTLNMTTFVNFWKTLDPKRQPGKGYGVQISGQWYWYQNMLDAFLNHLKNLES